jgi:hypothetical protein
VVEPLALGRRVDAGDVARGAEDEAHIAGNVALQMAGLDPSLGSADRRRTRSSENNGEGHGGKSSCMYWHSWFLLIAR